MIIIETPAPPTRERLVLVPVGETHAHCRGATPEDLARAGYVLESGANTIVEEYLARAEKAERERDDLLEGDMRPEDLARAGYVLESGANTIVEEYLARAEKAERERDDLLEGDMREARTQRERADQAERERDEARAELARLTAAAEGEPTPGQLLDACPPSGGRLLACYRLGVAHERARQQPAQDRATDEELADLYAREYDAQAHQTRDTFSKSHNDCRRAGILAVAARVRGERCLVARAVGDQLIDSVSIDRVTGGRIRVRVVRRRDPIANPDGESVEAFCKRRSDVPATLARLLGEVSRG